MRLNTKKHTPFVVHRGDIFVEVIKILPILEAVSFPVYAIFDDEPSRRYIPIAEVIDWAERHAEPELLKLLHRVQAQVRRAA